ncbi:DotI/IcmL family type IV secretion protein [Acinetobacter gyllenbergii]|uniref:DotI/IcmL family type IV secretion protein n=1 Tax=Acinetobacter gyllenbergii TaxID=134534 RepID=UPI003F55C5CF
MTDPNQPRNPGPKVPNTIDSRLAERDAKINEINARVTKQRLWLAACFIVIPALVIALVLLIVMLSKMPKAEAFQTIDNSVICKINPNDNPAFTNTNIAEFAKEAVLNAYSIDYKNADTSTTDILRRYFTDKGRSSFITTLRQSGLIEQIKQNYLVLQTSALQTPEVTNDKGIDNFGNRFWIVQVPIRMDYFNGKNAPADSRTYVAEIRVEVTQRDVFNPKGIGVSSIILRTK